MRATKLLRLPLLEMVFLVLAFLQLTHWLIMPGYEPSYGTREQYFENFNNGLVVSLIGAAVLSVIIELAMLTSLKLRAAIFLVGTVTAWCTLQLIEGPNIGLAAVHLIAKMVAISGLSLLFRELCIRLLPRESRSQ